MPTTAAVATASASSLAVADQRPAVAAAEAVVTVAAAEVVSTAAHAAAATVVAVTTAAAAVTVVPPLGVAEYLPTQVALSNVEVTAPQGLTDWRNLLPDLFSRMSTQSSASPILVSAVLPLVGSTEAQDPHCITKTVYETVHLGW